MTFILMLIFLLCFSKSTEHDIELSSSSKRELKFNAGDVFKIELNPKKIIDVLFFSFDDSAIDMEIICDEGTQKTSLGKYSSQSYFGYHSLNQKTIFQGSVKSTSSVVILTRIYPYQCNDYFYSTSPKDYFYIDSKPNGKCNLTLKENSMTCFFYAPGSVSEGRVRYSVPIMNSFFRFFVNDEMSEIFRSNGEFTVKEIENPLFILRYGPDILTIFDAFHPMLEITQTSKSERYFSAHIDDQKSKFLLWNKETGKQPPFKPIVPNVPVATDAPRIPEPTIKKEVPIPTSSLIPAQSIFHAVEDKKSKIEKDDVKVLALAITFGTIGSILVIGLLVLIGFICYQKMKTQKYGLLRNRLEEENVQIFDPQYYQPPSYPVDPYYPRYQYERNYPIS